MANEGNDAMKFTFGPESRPLDGFTIKRAIARGGFGEVYYALSDSGKEAAIKLLQDNLEVELRGVSQCLNLKHPNLVTIFDIKQDRDGDHWIVMEFVGGKTLDRVIHEHQNGLPLGEVVAWLDGIAAGIGFLHDRGLVHRDLKPANIFRESGVVKVGDVGLSKFIAPSRRSAHTQSVGTVYYMAPEVAKGRYGREVDVYSLAIILYELLTGKVPFDGETTAEILMKHLTERPNLDPIAPAFRPIINAALEKDPDRRTNDVLQLANAFRSAARSVSEIQQGNTEILFTDNSRQPTLADTQPFPAPPPLPVRPSVFPNPEPAKSWIESFARSFSRGAGSFWQRHPMLTVAALLTLASVATPRWQASAGRIAGSPGRAVWIVIGLAISYEVFRSVSRTVDRWFGPPLSDAANDSSARSRRLTPVITPSVRRAGYRVPDPDTIRPVSLRRRMTELTGSLAAAGLATALVTGALAFATNFFTAPALVGHFAAGTLLGSWGLLTLNKLREGLARERYIERLFLAGIGVLVGLAMFQLHGWLLIQLPNDGWSPRTNLLAMTWLGTTSSPQQTLATSYAAFFATLFGLRRWWWHMDSFRPHRFRIMSVILTAIVGNLAARWWGIPVVWGTIWAASLSSVVQLAAVWTPPHQRD